MEKEYIKKFKKKCGERMFKTDIKNLDSIIGGGFPENRVSAIFGSPAIGKSMMCIQTAVNALLVNKKVVYISSMSEKDSSEYLNIYNNRYPELQNKKKNIDFIYVSDLQDLADKFDYFLNINYSNEKSDTTMGKASIIIRNQTEDIIEQKNWKRRYFENYNLIIIDSLSELVKLDIFSEMQNFPARSQCLMFLFSIFNDAINDYDNTFLITHHLTKAITGYGNANYIWGGASIGYLSKHIIEIDNPKKSSYERFKKEGRSIKIYRWPAIAETEFYDVCLLENWGYVDIDQFKEKTGKDPDKKQKRGRKRKEKESMEIGKDIEIEDEEMEEIKNN